MSTGYFSTSVSTNSFVTSGWFSLFVEGRFPPRTMKSVHGRWPSSMVRHDGPTYGPISFLFLNQFTKPLGPSLGVNRMWTKRNDHAPKNECASFLLKYMSKRVALKRKEKKRKENLTFTILLSFLVIIFSFPIFLFWCKMKWSWDKFNKPITNPTGPWDNVHGPLV